MVSIVCLLTVNPLLLSLSYHRSKILLGAEERYRMGVWLDNKLLVEEHNLLYYKVMAKEICVCEHQSPYFHPRGR